MEENNQPNRSPLAIVLQEVFGNLIATTSKLPAPLAYGSAIVIGILVVTLFGIILPNNLIWLIGIIVLTALSAFVFLDWQARKNQEGDGKNRASSAVMYVIVHEAGDRTALISQAHVTLALPEPQIKLTQANGAANFTIPGHLAGKSFAVNVRREGYCLRKPDEVVIKDESYVYLSLEPLGKDALEKPADQEQEERKHEIVLTQIRPQLAKPQGPFSSGLVTLGRNPDSTVTFPSDTPKISWDHGLVLLQRGAFYYRHLSNSAPTVINRITGESRLMRPNEEEEYRLENNDRLILGDYEFAVSFNISGISSTPWTPTDTADTEQEI